MGSVKLCVTTEEYILFFLISLCMSEIPYEKIYAGQNNKILIKISAILIELIILLTKIRLEFIKNIVKL